MFQKKKSCRENPNKNFMFNTFFFRKSAVYEITWKNILQWAGHRLRYGACAAKTRASVIHTLPVLYLIQTI